VQLMALALAIDATLHLGPVAATVAAGTVVAGYTAIGGYRVATETDAVQAAVIRGGGSRSSRRCWRATAAGYPQRHLPCSTLAPGACPSLWRSCCSCRFRRCWPSTTGSASPPLSGAQAARRTYYLVAAVCGPVYLVLAHVGHVGGAGAADMAAVVSMGAGTAITLLPSALALDLAAVAGFAISMALYAGLRPRR